MIAILIGRNGDHLFKNSGERKVTAIPATISRYTAAPINSTKKRRVAGYARVSTDHEDQSTSYEAQEESRSISENVTWGQRKRMADGKVSFAYSRFLGLDKDKETGKIVVNPEQAETVRLIFHLFLEGMTPHSIAAELTSRGIKTPAGKDVWNQQTVRRMLSNEKYKGDALLQKEFTVQRREHLLQQDKMRRLRRLVRLEGLAFHGQVPQGHLPLQPKVQRR